MRKLICERLYSLKQYENIKLVDEIDLSELGLGKEVLVDLELYNRLRYLQFVSLEMSYRKYLLLLRTLREMNLDDSLQHLEQEKVTTIDLIKSIILGRIREE